MVVARQVVFRVLAACLAFVPAMLFGVAAVNKYYDYYQSWGAVVADFTNQSPNVSKPIIIPDLTSTKFSKILGSLVNNASARQSGYTVQLTITGARTQLKRTVYIYLPPQYFQKAYANYRFPAIELFTGYPGEPQDWMNVMGVTSTLSTLVRDNLARPAVLVMPDTEGALRQTLECLNLPGGIQDATYLAQDVPDYVSRAIRVQPPGAAWGMAGYSEGGFCAANLAVRYRKLFGFAGVLSGYFSPLPVLVGKPARYEQPFPGDRSLREANTPMDALPLVPSWAFVPKFWIGAGTGDRGDVQQADAFQQLLLQRQPKVKVVLAPGGGHTMFTWRDLVTPMLEWMTPQLAAEARRYRPASPALVSPACPTCLEGQGTPPAKSSSSGPPSG
ncbi:MAG TPA: alpha/beta hydrolase-fold protein [Streptosporangiaceae bacterium]